MATQYAPIDPVERELTEAQLQELALAHDGQPWCAWKDAVAEWHVQSLAAARAEAWIPGLAGSQDPIIEEALGRFYRHHVRAVVNRLRAENLELRRKMLEALECARFYASGRSDAGQRANAALRSLLPPATAPHAGTKPGPSH